LLPPPLAASTGRVKVIVLVGRLASTTAASRGPPHPVEMIITLPITVAACAYLGVGASPVVATRDQVPVAMSN
jgi:hypothetical protein